MVVSAVVEGTNRDRYVVELRANGHPVVSDEPEGAGGTDRGASPFGLVVAGLGACTLITLRMYADRKGWPVTATRVEMTMTRERSGDRIERQIVVQGGLDDAQRERMLQIADKTPVTEVLRRALTIDSTIAAGPVR